MSTSTDPDSLSGNLSNAMARHTRAAKNGVLAVVMGSVRNHVDYRPTGDWSVVKDVIGNEDITATVEHCGGTFWNLDHRGLGLGLGLIKG